MKNLFLVLGISLFAAVFTINEADAKRFGGGKSFGRSAPKFQQNKPVQQQAARQNSRQTPGTANSGARRWLGPVAGLVAGGLIGAMLFGDGFENFQIMDFILIAALIFGAVFLFRKLFASRAPQQQYAAAGASGQAPYAGNDGAPPIGSGLGSGAASGAADQRPDWFNEEEFLQGAKTHFVRLQAAWDVADMRDIRDYTTPQLFSELTLERQSYQGEKQFTEVVELNAELLGVTREDDKLIAAVSYTGMIREEQGADAQPFSEVWRIERDDRQDANWLISGIEQSSGSLRG